MALKVLVVDDHDSLRDLFRVCLSLEDDLELVGVAGDGVYAVELTAALQPDAIVLDLEMPIADGLDALPALHAAAPGAKVVMFSATTDDATRAQALAGGCAAYLIKDDSGVSDVLAAVRRVTQRDLLTA